MAEHVLKVSNTISIWSLIGGIICLTLYIADLRSDVNMLRQEVKQLSIAVNLISKNICHENIT